MKIHYENLCKMYTTHCELFPNYSFCRDKCARVFNIIKSKLIYLVYKFYFLRLFFVNENSKERLDNYILFLNIFLKLLRI